MASASADLDRLALLIAEGERLVAVSRDTRRIVQDQRALRDEMDDTPPLVVHARQTQRRTPFA